MLIYWPFLTFSSVFAYTTLSSSSSSSYAYERVSVGDTWLTPQLCTLPPLESLVNFITQCVFIKQSQFKKYLYYPQCVKAVFFFSELTFWKVHIFNWIAFKILKKKVLQSELLSSVAILDFSLVIMYAKKRMRRRSPRLLPFLKVNFMLPFVPLYRDDSLLHLPSLVFPPRYSPAAANPFFIGKSFFREKRLKNLETTMLIFLDFFNNNLL